MTSIRTLFVISIYLLALVAWADDHKAEQPKVNQPIQAWGVSDWWVVYSYVSDPLGSGERDRWQLNGSNLVHLIGKEIIGKTECFKAHVYSSSNKEPDIIYYRCDNLGIIGPENKFSTEYLAERVSRDQVQLGIPPIVNSTIAQILQKASEKIGTELFNYIKHPQDNNRVIVKSPITEKASKYYEYSSGGMFYDKAFSHENNNVFVEICITKTTSKNKKMKIDDAITEWKKEDNAEHRVAYTTGELIKKYDLAQLLKVANINVPDENKGQATTPIIMTKTILEKATIKSTTMTRTIKIKTTKARKLRTKPKKIPSRINNKHPQ